MKKIPVIILLAAPIYRLKISLVSITQTNDAVVGDDTVQSTL